VQSIIQNINGAVTVESRKGYGSQFRIYFPVIEQETSIDQDLEQEVLKGEEHILFVDDEAPLVNLGRQLLERLGYKVTVCTNSLEALSIFSQTPDAFDLVITDMTMPHMTGDEMARRMLTIRPQIPIIVCTGYSERVTDQMIESMGLQALIMKPMVRSEIARAIRNALDHQTGKT
jgi:CheY-like chemotaxis protein